MRADQKVDRATTEGRIGSHVYDSRTSILIVAVAMFIPPGQRECSVAWSSV